MNQSSVRRSSCSCAERVRPFGWPLTSHRPRWSEQEAEERVEAERRDRSDRAVLADVASALGDVGSGLLQAPVHLERCLGRNLAVAVEVDEVVAARGLEAGAQVHPMAPDFGWATTTTSDAGRRSSRRREASRPRSPFQ